MICLAEGDPAGALGAVRHVFDGTAPVIGYVTVVEAHLLAGLAHRELGDRHAAHQAAERALALAESDRLVLPFAMTCSGELLEELPRHETAHAALLTDILDVLHGSSPAAEVRPRHRTRKSSARASSGSCDISRRTCPGLRSPASCPSRRTRSARTSAASTPSSRSGTGLQPCSARGSCACCRPAARDNDDRVPAREGASSVSEDSSRAAWLAQARATCAAPTRCWPG